MQEATPAYTRLPHSTAGHSSTSGFMTLGQKRLEASVWTLLLEQPHHNGLLNMEAVFGLIEHNGLWPVQHFGCNFFAAMGG